MLRVSKRRPVARPGASFSKAVDPNNAEERQAELERQFIRALNAALDALGKPHLEDDVLASIIGGDANPLLSAYNWVDFARELREVAGLLNNEAFQSAQSGLREAMNAGIKSALISAVTYTGSPGIMQADLAILDQFAIDYAAARSGELVVQITNEIRETVRDLVWQSVSGIYTPQELAGLIKQIIPLHDRFANAVLRRNEALFKQFIKQGMNIDEAKAKALALSEKYAAKLTRLRARTIARTEIMTASGEGHMEGWISANQSGLIGTGWQKVWLTAQDERVCPQCGPLDQEKVAWDGTFSWGGRTSPRHPNCRCDVALVPDEV